MGYAKATCRPGSVCQRVTPLVTVEVGIGEFPDAHAIQYY
jgi:hypothetical protein